MTKRRPSQSVAYSTMERYEENRTCMELSKGSDIPEVKLVKCFALLRCVNQLEKVSGRLQLDPGLP